VICNAVLRNTGRANRGEQYGSKEHKEAEANACLIAAAHDLLEALQSAPIIGAGESSEDFRIRQDAWLKGQYRAAIAKARGQS
jgi:hypothetical protein